LKSEPSTSGASLRLARGGSFKQPGTAGIRACFQWVHNQAFGFAKEEGWLDALVFYGFETPAPRDTDVWEHCESGMEEKTASIGSGICGVEAFQP